MESHAENIIKMINQQKKLQQLQQNDINKGYAEIFYDTIKFERKKLYICVFCWVNSHHGVCNVYDAYAYERGMLA